jgi:hypothetical protein
MERLRRQSTFVSERTSLSDNAWPTNLWGPEVIADRRVRTPGAEGISFQIAGVIANIA